MKFPSFSQWEKLPTLLSKKERASLLIFILGFVGSAIFLLGTFYYNHTKSMPNQGGSFKEGIVGSPRFINPIFSDANDADRDLVQLVFSGLFSYDAKGAIVPDLAKDYTIGDDGKTFEIQLKDNLRWSDGFPLKADDVVYTVNTLQDQRYKSPVRANWIGVNVEKVSDLKVRFTLSQPYAPFLERLTLKIIPSHIWQSVSPENFALSVYNLQPVGSGPFRVKSIARAPSGSISQIQLVPNLLYQGKAPYIQSLTFLFFENAQQVKGAFKNHQVQAFSPDKPESVSHEFSLPRYFALFFNLASPNAGDPVKQKNIRLALSQAISQEELIAKLFGNWGKPVSSPFLPELFGLSKSFPAPKPNQNDILALLSKQGYSKVNGHIVKIPPQPQGLLRDLALGSKGVDVKKLQSCLAQDKQVYPEGTTSGSFGSQTKEAVIAFQKKYGIAQSGAVGAATREKLNELCFAPKNETIPLTITITTLDQSPLRNAAKMLKEQLEEIGITAEVELKDASTLEREVIKPRNYQTLLFGEILGTIPDPFPFWHSSQKKDPGLNLSSYENKKLDTMLEQARRELDPAKRSALFSQMQTIILADMPLIPLYDTPYLYTTSPQIKGITNALVADPSKRFAGISDWYMNTKRVWK